LSYDSNYDVNLTGKNFLVSNRGSFGTVIASNLRVTSSALPDTDTTIAYKVPIVVNGTTYYISLTAAQ
jgi:hypothetical protein